MACLIQYKDSKYTPAEFEQLIRNNPEAFYSYLSPERQTQIKQAQQVKQKTEEELDTPKEYPPSVISKVRDFLKRAGIDVKKVNQIVVNGNRIDANAVADISNKLIQVIEGREDIALPEEAMHFGVEILEQTNTPLFNRLMSDIGAYEAFKYTLAEYRNNPYYQKDGKPDIRKIKKEAIARVLVDTIVSKNGDNIESPEKITKAESWWEQILNWIKQIFNKAGTNPFIEAGKQILEIKEPSQYDLSGTTEIYLQQNRQTEIYEKLKNIANQINLVENPSHNPDDPNSRKNYYAINGKPIGKRVTDKAKKWYYEKFRNRQVNKTELQQAVDEQKAEKGTAGHADLEDIFHRIVDDNGFIRPVELDRTNPSQLDPNDLTYYDTLEENLRERLLSFKAGSRFLSEVTIYDSTGSENNQDTAGTMDLVVIEPNGKFHILDWKFIDVPEAYAQDVPWYKKEAWNIQIGEYKRILRDQYGIERDQFGQTRAIPIRASYTYEAGAKDKLKLFGIKIGDVNTKLVKDDILLPVPTKDESTGNKQLDKLIDSLNNFISKIFETPSKEGEEYVKIQRINDLTIAVRRLQLKQEADSLFDFAKADMKRINQFFKKYMEVLNSGNQEEINKLSQKDLSKEILDSWDVIELYSTFSRTFRNIFDLSDPENSDTAKQVLDISSRAEIIKDNLTNLSNKLRTDVVSKGLSVEDMLEPEKVVSAVQKWVRSLSQASTKATSMLWQIVKTMSGKYQIRFDEAKRDLVSIKKEVEDWISQGRSYKDLEKLIFEYDSKGRWTGEVAPRISREFYAEISRVLTDKDTEWVTNGENIDIEAYRKWYTEEYQKRLESAEVSVLNEDPEKDAEMKRKRMQDFEKQYDIFKYPSTAISKANLKIQTFPILNNWKSSQYAEIEKNAPVLKLYNHWQKKLERSKELGMIKSWQAKTFFPNVRKDFLDKLVFGVKDKEFKNANLGFLDSVRIDVNDEVFGYTDVNGNPQDKFSAMYTYDLGEKVQDSRGNEFTDYSNKSTDIFKVMALWDREMIKYELKDEYVDVSRLLYLTEQNRKSLARSKKTGGISYKESGEPVEIDNVENSQYYKNFHDFYFYGKRLTEGADVTFKFKYNNLANKVNSFFRSDLMPKSNEDEILISGRKVIRATNRFFQMKTLGLNVTTAVTNYFGGSTNALINAGKFFDKSDFLRGQMMIASAKFHTEEGRKYAALINYFLPLTEDTSYEQANKLSTSRTVKALSSDHLFYLMRGSDKMVQYPASIAFFDNTMVENGQLVNIREKVKAENDYNQIYNLTPEERTKLNDKIEKEIAQLKREKSLSKIVEIENDIAKIPEIERESSTVIDFRNRIQQFSKDALGNMSEEDISAYRMTLIGQSFMMFKNWIPRMADVRFGELRYQPGTDAYEWGRFRMLANALKNGGLKAAKDAMATLVGAKEGMIELAKKVYQQKKVEFEERGEPFKMSEAEFIDNYIKGARSTIKEVGIWLAMTGLWLFAKTQAPDKEEDPRERGAYKWMLRTVDKMSDEISFFYNPLSFTAIANGSVFPAIGILNDIIRFLTNLSFESYYTIIGDEEGKKKTKVMKYLFKTLPVTKELIMYAALFNEDLAKEYGIKVSTESRRNY